MKDDIEKIDVGAAAAKAKGARNIQSNIGSESKQSPNVVSKAIKDESKPGTASPRGTPLTSRPSSVLSRNSSTSSVTKPERRESKPSEPQRDKSRNEIKRHNPSPVSQINEAAPQPDTNQYNGGNYGPSGGSNGLNSQANCVRCGSFAHYSFNCENAEASAIAVGTCLRCYLPGHLASSCFQPRCIACGEVGHVTQDCKAPAEYKLTSDKQETVRREEVKWGQVRDKERERRARKQLGEHGAKVPSVRSSVPQGPAALTHAKRKRDEGMRDPSRGKVHRVDNSNVNDRHLGPRDSNALQPSAVHPPSSVRPPGNASPAAGLPRPPPTGPGARPGMAPGQQVIRRKKANADAMFVKKK